MKFYGFILYFSKKIDKLTKGMAFNLIHIKKTDKTSTFFQKFDRVQVFSCKKVIEYAHPLIFNFLTLMR